MKVLLVGFSLMFSCAIVSFSTDAWSQEFVRIGVLRDLRRWTRSYELFAKLPKKLSLRRALSKTYLISRSKSLQKSCRENYIRKKAR